MTGALTLVHPHASTFGDLCAHVTAITVMLGIAGAFSRARLWSPRE